MSKYATSPIQRQVCGIDKPQEIEEVTEDAYERIKKILDSEPPKKKVDVRLSKTEKIAMHADILDRLRAKTSPESIALSVMAAINEHLEEKHKESTGEAGVKGPMFRRVE